MPRPDLVKIRPSPRFSPERRKRPPPPGWSYGPLNMLQIAVVNSPPLSLCFLRFYPHSLLSFIQNQSGKEAGQRGENFFLHRSFSSPLLSAPYAPSPFPRPSILIFSPLCFRIQFAPPPPSSAPRPVSRATTGGGQKRQSKVGGGTTLRRYEAWKIERKHLGQKPPFLFPPKSSAWP